jgi:hypothetical protein
MRVRFPFPAQVEGIDSNWKRFLNLLFDDLYPQLQTFTPVFSGVTGSPTVTSGLVRMGRLWNVNIELTGASTASSAYLDLPFASFATSLFLIKVDTDTAPKVAYIEKNTTRLYLPNWTSSSRVIISGTAGE